MTLAITVVVPFGRPENWPLVLENFARQEHAERRLLIVENNQALGAPRPELPPGTVVIQSEPTPARARNRGIAWMREHGGGAVSFCDDDDYYGPGYLTEVATALDGHPDRVAVKAFRYVRWDNGLHYCLAEQPAPTYGCTLSGFSERLPDFLCVHLEDLVYKPELDREGLSLHVLSDAHYIYNRRTVRGARECDVTQLQYLRSFGPAVNLGDVSDSVANVPGVPRGTRVPQPTWDELLVELGGIADRQSATQKKLEMQPQKLAERAS